MTEDAASQKSRASLEDLLIPAIPGLITTMILEAMKAFNGPQKIGLATGLGVLLWWLMRRRRGLKSHLAAALRQQWRWAIVGLASLTVLALIVTVVTFERPTPTTVTVSLLALANSQRRGANGSPDPRRYRSRLVRWHYRPVPRDRGFVTPPVRDTVA